MVLQPVGAGLQEGTGEFMLSFYNDARTTLARGGWSLVVCLLWGGRLALAAEAASGWDVDRPMGPQWTQQIDVVEGTWIHVDVSPDGQQIVFDLLGDLYLMPVTGADGRDGSVPRKLTSGGAWDMQPRFSPDGAHVAFTSDRQGKSGRGGDNIWRIAVDGTQLRQVTNETFRLLNGPDWSPDGRYLVARKHFTSRRSLGAGEMWLYHRDALSLNATAGVRLTSRPDDQKDVNEPAFSPDGKYLYYSQDVSPGNTFQYNKDSNQQIYAIQRLDLARGETERLVTGAGGACRPTPSPDGKRLAFVRRVGAKTGLHLFDLDSGAVRLVYDGLERDMQETWAIHGVYPGFAWMPDGQAIVIWAKGKIRRINLADGTARVIPFHIQDERQMTRSLRVPVEVAPENWDVRMLRWVQVSPRADQVVYQALGHIYLRALPDGRARRLTTQSDHFEFFPRFSRDGTQIVYTTWNDNKLGSVRVAVAEPGQAEGRVVTQRPGHYGHPVFSPDGQTIVFERRGGGHLTSPLWSRDPGICRVAAAGGRAERISRAGFRPDFGAESDRVYYLKSQSDKSGDHLQYCSMDLSGNEQRVHYTSLWATDYRISPDRKWIAFIERFRVYLAPFVDAGRPIAVGPGGKGIPVIQASQQAGDWIHFSGDSQRLHWALGSQLYSHRLSLGATQSEAPPEPSQGRQIGFQVAQDRPRGTLALVGGRLLTMGPQGEISDGSVVIEGNRIVAIGPTGDVKIPQDARRVELDGRTVLPGFVDTHAHGAQAAAGIIPQRNWIDYARLAFGVTTIHDPSNDTHSIFAASEMARAGVIVAPRTFSTGTILYGAAGANKAEIDSLEDALFHLRRMQAVGAFSVKSYNQPRRDQRQQVIAAARQLGMMVVPEGGSTLSHNLTMIVDGHTGIEHTLSVQTAYDDVFDLWRDTGVGYTPTLSVAYGGLAGEQYWYEVDDLWLHPRLQSFIPPHELVPRSRRRNKAPREDYNHIRVAEIAQRVVAEGGLVQAGGHGQLNGICTHWEMWSFVQGGMTPLQALRCGTLNGARYLGLDGDLGSLEAGKLADLVVIEKGYDPALNIRHSERIDLVVANGRVFDARRMNAWGDPAPRDQFYWQRDGYGLSQRPAHSAGCSCQRVGGRIGRGR